MKDARETFEILMKANGYDNLTRNDKGQYVVPSVQTRWKYFLFGWEMRGLT
jgi:hypothetical protein